VNHIGPHTTPNSTSTNSSSADRKSASAVSGKLNAYDRQSSATSSGNSSDGSVQLSNQAVDLNALEKAAQQAPDINASKVVSLHNRINAGTYQIDSESIASEMMAYDELLD